MSLISDGSERRPPLMAPSRSSTVAATIIEATRRTGRIVLPRPVYSLASRSTDFASAVRRFGYTQARILDGLVHGTCSSGKDLVAIEVPGLKQPFYLRPGTSDASSFLGTWARENYSSFLPTDGVEFIVDAGAYIGDSTAWYLTRFPCARVVAIEPDPSNFVLLERNCAAFGSRLTVLNSAVWSEDVPVSLVRTDRHDASSIVPVAPGAPFSCEGISLNALLASLNESRIDILKCDIEGAETELFSHNAESWLKRTRSIFIELHGPAAEAAIENAVTPYTFYHRRHREIHIFLDRDQISR
jgi:FkbM family methyltransferase